MKSGLVLQRKIFTDHSTIGDLYLDGEFQCETLEDTIRNQKIDGMTAIPAGEYEVIIRASQRYGRPMPYLLKVPFFEGIMIHTGNSDKDVRGCIAVGQYDPNQKDFISTSRHTFDELFPKIEKALLKSRLFINIYGGYSKEDFKPLSVA